MTLASSSRTPPRRGRQGRGPSRRGDCGSTRRSRDIDDAAENAGRPAVEEALDDLKGRLVGCAGTARSSKLEPRATRIGARRHDDDIVGAIAERHDLARGPVDEVARRLTVDPAKGLTAAEVKERRRGTAERARGQEEGVRLAGVRASVQRRHADGAAGRRDRQPDLHAGDQHDARAARADRLQRGAGHEPGGQGRGQPGRAAEDDEEHRPRAPRRRGRRGRRRGAGAGRHRADRGGQPRAGRRPALRCRHARDRRGRAHRRERRLAQGHRRRSPSPDVAARRPHRHGVHEHRGHARPRRDDRDQHRHGHRDGPHRRPAQPDRGRQDAAAEAARPADHDHRRPRRPRVHR